MSDPGGAVALAVLRFQASPHDNCLLLYIGCQCMLSKITPICEIHACTCPFLATLAEPKLAILSALFRPFNLPLKGISCSKV